MSKGRTPWAARSRESRSSCTERAACSARPSTRGEAAAACGLQPEAERVMASVLADLKFQAIGDESNLARDSDPYAQEIATGQGPDEANDVEACNYHGPINSHFLILGPKRGKIHFG